MNFDKNILLIYPPDREEDTAPAMPPLGLAHLASYIRNNTGDRHKITLWDLNLNRLTRDQFKQRLMGLEGNPDIIGIGGIVTVFNHLLWMSRICKEVFPETVLVAGGSVASTVPHLLFQHSPVDICVEGEGERSLLEIIKSVEKGVGLDELRNIPGLILRDDKNTGIVHTEHRTPNPDLDVLGMPAYDLIDVKKYSLNGICNLKFYEKDIPSEVYAEGNLHMPILSSRGCTARCNFCYRQFPRIELNSADFIRDHIVFLNSQYGINIVTFSDELFNVSEKRLNDMIGCLSEVKEKIDNFYFRIGGARTDVINVSTLKKMRALGCFQIIYGLESGSQKMLDLIKKRATVKQNYDAVIAAKDAGIHCVPQFIVGLPGEDMITLKDTLRFIDSIDFWSYLSVHNANAYPGSEIYQFAKEKGLIKDEFAYVSNLGGTEQYPLALAEISPKVIRRALRKYFIARQIRLTFKNNTFFRAIFILILWLGRKIFNAMKIPGKPA